MSIAVTGSVAVDHLATFPGLFSKQLVPDKLEHISLSFLVDQVDVHHGGVAANVAAGLARLGHRPLLVAAAGGDFAGYRALLEDIGVDTAGVLIRASALTAQFWCTTDRAQNQIASFHPGAMTAAKDIALADTLAPLERIELVVIAPNDPDAMARHTDDCRELGVPFAADPSQQLARLDGERVRRLVDGARYLFTNEYEHALLLRKTGWNEDDVHRRVGAWVTTLGANGARVDQAGRRPVTVSAVPPVEVADPTGAGDGFRAGFLAARGWGLPYADAARLGCAVATEVLETKGTLDYELDGARLLERITGAHGAEAASALAGRLTPALAVES